MRLETEVEVSEGRRTGAVFVAGSALLQELHDRAPSGQFTLQWLIWRLRKESYPAIIFLLAIMAAVPGISLPAGLLLLVPTLQMIAGRPTPGFPRWIADRPLPTDILCISLRRAIPILKVIEKAIRPRWARALAVASSIAGIVILLLALRLLAWPLPLSNVIPGVIIAMIALSCLEQDGLMLVLTLLAGLVVLVVDAKVFYDLLHVGRNLWSAISA
jgi:hypothetical protein